MADLDVTRVLRWLCSVMTNESKDMLLAQTNLKLNLRFKGLTDPIKYCWCAGNKPVLGWWEQMAMNCQSITECNEGGCLLCRAVGLNNVCFKWEEFLFNVTT